MLISNCRDSCAEDEERTVGLSKNGVDEVDGTKRASNKRKDSLAVEVDLSVSAAVGKDLVVSHLPQRQFAVVTVSREILLRKRQCCGTT